MKRAVTLFLLLFLAAAAAPAALGFVPAAPINGRSTSTSTPAAVRGDGERPGGGSSISSTTSSVSDGGAALTRGDLLQRLGATAVLSLLSATAAPGAGLARGLPTGPSKAELLEKTRKKKDDDESPEERKARLAKERKERLERQRQIEAEEEARKKDPNRKEVEIDADLRANYYYPTARKRYLPRIKAVADAFGDQKANIQSGAWDKVQAFADREAANAALPLKLYASSLTGQGLSLEVSFVKTLEDQGNAYGKELEAFKKAVKGKDKGKALAALEKMEAAVALYRKTARIDTPDGGIGEFPTDSKLGASFSNNNPALLKRTIK